MALSSGVLTPASPAPALAGLYVHVPFCRSKCPYCDFYSLSDLGLIAPYVQALLTELTMRRQRDFYVDSIYFGGGTPSTLEPHQVARILEAVDVCFGMAADVEISLEVNPGTVDREKLVHYRQVGINRVNIGLQSTDDRVLAFLGRIHQVEQGVDTLRWARAAGFDNVGLDLIYGIPGQTRRGWRADMARAVQLAPDHLACYNLTIAPGTPMAAGVENGTIQLPNERLAADLFASTAAYLNRNGYRQYEISNFFRPGGDGAADRRSRHNWKYWILAPYLGFGPAAHSFLDNRRWWNHRSLGRYLTDLKGGVLPVAGRETLSREQQIMEYVYLGLRRTEGIELAGFKRRFNADFEDCFGPALIRLTEGGLVETVSGRVRLTDRGMRLLESVADRLLSVHP